MHVNRTITLLCFSVIALIILNQFHLFRLTDTSWLLYPTPTFKENTTLLFMITTHAAEAEWRDTLRNTFLSTPSNRYKFI